MTTFNGKTHDSRKFPFSYEHVATGVESDKDRALEFLGFLDRDAFVFYYNTFALNVGLTTEDFSYRTVKTEVLERFAGPWEPNEYIRKAVTARLDYGDQLGSFKQVDAAFDKAGFNSEAKIGMLRDELRNSPTLPSSLCFLVQLSTHHWRVW